MGSYFKTENFFFKEEHINEFTKTIKSCVIVENTKTKEIDFFCYCTSPDNAEMICDALNKGDNNGE